MQQEILIEKISKEGYGLGFFRKENGDSSVRVEVPHTLPGDRILALLRKKRRGKIKGRLLDILEASKDRLDPKCLHWQICGGCSLHCMHYPQQLRYKQTLIKETFPEYDSDLFYPIIGCKHPWYYRNKMEFSFSENRAGTKFLGLMIARANRYVFNIEECYLGNTWFSQVLQEVRRWWDQSDLKAFCFENGSGSLRNLTLREGKNTKEKMVILTVSGNPIYALKKHQIDAFVQEIKKGFSEKERETLSIILRIHQAIEGERTRMYDMVLYGKDTISERLTVTYNLSMHSYFCRISPSSFFQPNTELAEMLFSKALEYAEPTDQDIVFDLYCGSGTIAMAFSPFVRKVIGIEINPDAVHDAKENIERNGLENVSVFQGDVEKVLANFMQQKDFCMPSIVVVDPPRAGLLKNTISQIKMLKPKKIVYISCNPKTQAEDIRSLVPFYTVKKIQPFDQFPQTVHIENIIYLTRN